MPAQGIATGIQLLQLGRQVKDLFSGNKSGSSARAAKRKELQRLGFDWKYTKGYQAQDANNIDGFYDQALDNLFKAYSVYGQPAIDVHNAGLLNDQIASNYSQLSQAIEDYRAKSNGTFFPLFKGQTGANDPNYKSSLESIATPTNLVVIVVLLILGYLIKQ